MPGDDVWRAFAGRQQLIDAGLRDVFAGLTADAPAAVRDAMAYSLFAPGKRLRPLLCGLACEAAGGDFREAAAAGAAVEMIHTYSLIHDDLPAMDDDDLRRGLPTCHVKYGEALAILAGDGLLTLAFEVVGRRCGPRAAAVSCVELAVGAGASGMVGGQVQDLTADGKIPGDRPADAAALEGIHRRKTGALFRAALRLGVYAAQADSPGGVNPVFLAAADDYAAAFGLAFQVTDDLLDVESSAETAGKRVGKDAARGKLTYPGLLGIEASRRKAIELGRDAVAAAGRFGPGGDPLARLARFVVARDR